jgi:hypothetical protein
MDAYTIEHIRTWGAKSPARIIWRKREFEFHDLIWNGNPQDCLHVLDRYLLIDSKVYTINKCLPGWVDEPYPDTLLELIREEDGYPFPTELLR